MIKVYTCTCSNCRYVHDQTVDMYMIKLYIHVHVHAYTEL